jgi:SAM-dependent methyltransferase
MSKKEYKLLKSELVNAKCDYCGSADFVKLFSNLVSCKTCGLVYANPRPSKKGLEKLYKNYYESKEDEVSGPNDVSVSYDNIQDDINFDREKLIERIYSLKGKILDIGCGVGYFLEACKKRGWSVFGVEPSKEAQAICRKKGIKIINRSQFGKYSKSFDCVTLFHVLEHLDSPKEYLKDISRLIRKNGVIMIEVPSIKSFNAKYQREKWWYIQDMHLFYFSPASIKNYLRSVGFKNIKIRPKGGFLINQMSGMEGGINKNYKLLKIVKKAYYFISETFNFSDCIQIIAQKK